MKEKPTESLKFAFGLVLMLGFHSFCYFLELLTYLFLVPRMMKLYQEFGIELPTITKYVLSIQGFRLIAILAMLGTLHFVAVGLYALLASFNQLQWARALALATLIIWLIWLIFHVVALGLPYLTIIEGLTSAKK